MRKFFILFITLGVIASCNQDDVIEKGSITGSVTDGTAGIENVKIELFFNSKLTQQTLTGVTGNFQFNEVMPGENRLVFSKEGYDDQSQNLTVGSGGVESVSINMLLQTGEIQGTAVDQTGNQVEGATVELIANFETQETTVTNSSGSFNFSGVRIGKYQVKISKEDYEGSDQVVTVNKNQSTSVNLTLLRQLGDLKVTVFDNFDSQLENFSYEIRENSNVVYSGNIFDESFFELEEIPIGTYEVAIEKTGFEIGIAEIEVEADEQKEEEIILLPQSLPSGGVLSSSVSTFTSNSATFTLDVIVVDSDANEIVGLSASDFNIADGEFSTGNIFDFTLSGVTEKTQNANGPYSAALLIDQSGSISSTDPNDARLQGAKIFLDALGPGDNATFSAFSSGGLLPQDPLTIFGPFTQDGRSFFNDVDQLANLVSGGTPLYNSTNSMIDYTFNNASNSNKAVIVFTDGEDTAGGSIDDIVNNANSKGVKVFTVGLSSGTDTQVLGEIAGRTGGAFLLAGDARQLVSMYGTLGKILSGSSQYYQTQWTVTTTQTSFPGWFTTQMDISTAQGPVSIPIHVSSSQNGIAIEVGNTNNQRVVYPDFD